MNTFQDMLWIGFCIFVSVALVGIGALVSRRRDAQLDKERLDWLKRSELMPITFSLWSDGFHILYGEKRVGPFSSCREAIDAARREWK